MGIIDFFVKIIAVKKYVVILICLLFAAGIVSFYFPYANNSNNKKIASPLPEQFSKKENSEVSSLDFWFPSLFGIFKTDKEVPEISAKSAIVYDLIDEKVIYDKNSKEKLPMASLTKIMTAMVAIDHKRQDDRYTVYPENLVGENTIGLSAGEVMNLEELLYGVFMYSANEAAEALASNTLGRDKFIKAMDDKAKAIGLENTNFTNPTGLEGDGDQHTTAYDLLVLARFAVSNYPEIIKASSTAKLYIPETEDHFAYDMYNQLNLVTTYPGVKGLKDGYTPEAGLCLVTYLDYEGHKIIGVILGSENRREEMKSLLDYSLTTQGVKPPPHS